MKKNKCAKIGGFLLSSALLGTLTGCVGYTEPETAVYAPAPAPGYYVQDEYVYYPAYQVYYNSGRHLYTYPRGHTWVTRSTPPRTFGRRLSASPSVRLDFHDSPSIHHAEVVRQYPKHWAPPGWHGRR